MHQFILSNVSFRYLVTSYLEAWGEQISYGLLLLSSSVMTSYHERVLDFSVLGSPSWLNFDRFAEFVLC
jgi:hypothetical protein